MQTPPRGIKAIRGEGILEIDWDGTRVVRFPFKFLRCACACAGCVHEFTGQPLLDPATVPEDVGIAGIEPVGAYAVKINWTDGHDTGLYTWQKLAALEPPV